jgi:pimeloyl-ACP methyl ester carboxylesterase
VSEIKHRTVETNGIHMYIAESGAGPLVVLCHGFPESWYSWRHQLHALAEAGFHAIAPDMRGYGKTDRPEQIDRYTLLHLVGDVVGLLDALGTETAVIVGHDWGAPVAWYAALLRPDRFRGVIGLSVPFIPRPPVRPTSIMPQTEDAQFFQLYFQSPGIAEAELERDVRVSIRSFLYSASGEGRDDAARDGREVDMVPRRGGWLSLALDESGIVASLAHRSGRGFLRRRICAHGISWRAELVPQYGPKLGTLSACVWSAGDSPGAVHRRGPRSRFGLSWDGPTHRQPVEVCTAAPENASVSRLRSLDPAGASPGGQPGCN